MRFDTVLRIFFENLNNVLQRKLVIEKDFVDPVLHVIHEMVEVLLEELLCPEGKQPIQDLTSH